MIEEIQKRPFVRPLFLWITGILCYAFLPASSLLYVLGVLSALVFLFLGFSWGQGHAELQYDSRWIWGAIVSVLIVCLAVEVCWYSDRRIALVNEPASSLDLLATKAQYSLVNTFDRLRLSDEEKSILATLTLGYKKAMSRETKRRFSLAGVSHILAVSGFHVAVICGFLSFFCSFMPRWGIGRWVRYIFLVQRYLVVMFAEAGHLYYPNTSENDSKARNCKNWQGLRLLLQLQLICCRPFRALAH